MNGYKTLREICSMLDLSRRAIQGYEKMGLVEPTARNKYGHLLYDDKAVRRIAGIQFFQKLGLGLKDILALTKMGPYLVSTVLENHMAAMEIEKDELEYLISKTDEVIDAVSNGDNDILEIVYRIIKKDTKT